MLIQQQVLFYFSDPKQMEALRHEFGPARIGAGPHPVELLPLWLEKPNQIHQAMKEASAKGQSYEQAFLGLEGESPEVALQLIQSILYFIPDLQIVAIANTALQPTLEGLENLLLLPPGTSAKQGLKLCRSQAKALWAINAQREMLANEKSLKRSLSHALKTPVQVIQGITENLLVLPLDQEQHDESIQQLSRESFRLKLLLEEISQSELLDETQHQHSLNRLELTSFVTSLTGHFAKESGLSPPQLDLPNHPINILAHEGMMTQVIVNLLIYTNDLTLDGNILLKLHEIDNMVWVRFSLSSRPKSKEDPSSDPNESLSLREATKYINALGSALKIEETAEDQASLAFSFSME